MAKVRRNKSEAAAIPPGAGSKSLLEVAWRAYQAGDSVLARRAAQLLLAGEVKEADQSVAKKLGKQLFVGGPDADARQVAVELAARTRVAAKPYLFALMAAAIWLLMIAIAHRG